MDRFEQLHERTLAVDLRELVPPVEIHDLPKERHLFHLALDQFAHFPDDLRDRPAALGTASPRHDAKSAMHVAALHDGDEGRRLARSQGVFADRFLRADFLRRVDDRKARVVHRAAGITDPGYNCALSFDQFIDVIRHPVKFLRADDEVEMRHQLEQLGPARLRHAAEKSEDRTRPLLCDAAEHAHFAEGFLLRHVAHTAGIQEHDIGFRLACRCFITTIEQRARDLFRVAFVHLAAVGFDEKFRHESGGNDTQMCRHRHARPRIDR